MTTKPSPASDLSARLDQVREAIAQGVHPIPIVMVKWWAETDDPALASLGGRAITTAVPLDQMSLDDKLRINAPGNAPGQPIVHEGATPPATQFLHELSFDDLLDLKLVGVHSFNVAQVQEFARAPTRGEEMPEEVQPKQPEAVAEQQAHSHDG